VSVAFKQDRYTAGVLVGWSDSAVEPNSACYFPTMIALERERVSIPEFVSRCACGWLSGVQLDPRLGRVGLSMKAISTQQKLDIVANSGKELAPLLQIFSYGETDEERLGNVSLDMLEFYAGYDPSTEDLEAVCRRAINEVKSGMMEGVERCFMMVVELRTRFQKTEYCGTDSE
jgi:hypothetical protein